MKIAIVGSRLYPDMEAVDYFVSMLPKGTTVISGEAPGVDTQAKEAAVARGLMYVGYRAQWLVYGRRAGAIRNAFMVEDADIVVAFWDGHSKGTKITMDMAREARKLMSPKRALQVLLLNSVK